MQATEEAFKLRLELVNQAEKLRQLAAENENLQAAAIDRVRIEQLDAKNKVLLQVGHGLAAGYTALHRHMSVLHRIGGSARASIWSCLLLIAPVVQQHTPGLHAPANGAKHGQQQ